MFQALAFQSNAFQMEHVMTDVAINLDSVLIWGLKGATGVGVYPIKANEGVGGSYVSYTRISDNVQDRVQGKGGSIHFTRIQITHVATTFETLRTLVSSVQTFLEGNNTEFSASIMADVHIEDREADDIYTAVKDYFIQWKSI